MTWRLTTSAREDLLLYNPESGDWTVATSEDGGTFSYRSGSWAPGFELEVHDVDGDGRDEVLAYAPESGRAMVCGWSEGAFSCRRGQMQPGAQLMLGDFDGRGVPEMLVYDPSTGRWTRTDPLDPDGRPTGIGQWQPGLTLIGKQ